MSTKTYAEQRRMVHLLTLTLVLAVGTYTYASERQTTTGPGQTGRSAMRRSGSGTETVQQAGSFQRASNLLDMEVQNRRGEKIGEIEDIVLNEKGDKIDYLALSLDEGQAASRLAIPADRLSLARDGQSVALRGTASSLARRYTVGKDDWPKSVGQSRMLKKDEAESRRVSDVLGMRVQGIGDEKVGQIEDLLIDLENGEIKQAAIASGGFLGFNQKLSTVEWTTVNVRNGVASVNITQQRLDQGATDSDEYWQQFGFEGEDGRTWQGSGRQTERQDMGDRRPGTRSYRDADEGSRRFGTQSDRQQDDDSRTPGARTYRQQTGN